MFYYGNAVKIFLIVFLTFLTQLCYSQEKLSKTACNNEWFQGEGTHYGGIAGGSGGHCSLPVDYDDIYHAAMNHIQYDRSNACGACVRVIGPKGEVTLKIVDECPECKFGDIDMTTAVFPQLANIEDGRINITWQYVPCPYVDEIKILFSPDSGPYYFKIQIRDSNYPITYVEYQKNDGSYDTIQREVYNYFVVQNGIDEDKSQTGPYNFRFTAITGERLYANNIPFSTTGLVYTGVQFESVACPDCVGVIGGTAQIDNCGECTGGTTGITPNSTCIKDCAGYWNGTAYIDACGRCVGGATGLTPCNDDCYGVPGGQAYIDNCGNCVGGETGIFPCYRDCNNEWGGTAFIDSCGMCAAGTTGILPSLDILECENKIVTQSIVLEQGWNLISVSVIEAVYGINNLAFLFQDLDVSHVKNTEGFWKPNQAEQLNSLHTIEPGMGYLVYMNTAGIIEISGIPVETPNLGVSTTNLGAPTGWQLIGYPGCTDAWPCVSTPISNYFNATNAETIKNFDGFWTPDGMLNSIENFEVGKGYFYKQN